MVILLCLEFLSNSSIEQTPAHPHLIPSSQRDIISNHCFLFVNTGQRVLERNTMSNREGQDLSTIHGTSMASIQ